MQQQEIHQFLERYFVANGCEIIDNEHGKMTVQLSIELDKELMNRPFYWHYLEKTGGIPNPMKLTFITQPDADVEDKMGQNIYFGSPKLHQIFQSSKKLAGYIRLYEEAENSQILQIPLKPWLGLNVKISYQCDRKRDVFKSIGLHLINGQIVEQFYEFLQTIKLTPKIPDFSFTLSPLIMPKSGISRVESYLKNEICKEVHSWADEARLRWKKDAELLEHFYEDLEDKGESYVTEKEALREQYEPKVIITIVNGGLFYLTSNQS